MYTTPTSAFFIWSGHMKNELMGVAYIAIIKQPRLHSSYDQVLPPCHSASDKILRKFFKVYDTDSPAVEVWLLNFYFDI